MSTRIESASGAMPLSGDVAGGDGERAAVGLRLVGVVGRLAAVRWAVERGLSVPGDAADAGLLVADAVVRIGIELDALAGLLCGVRCGAFDDLPVVAPAHHERDGLARGPTT